MHAAKLEKSTRLRRVKELLLTFPEGLTTMEIATAAGSVAVHSDVAELRANGLGIECQYEGRTAEGRRVYRYVLCRPLPLTQSTEGRGERV